MAQHFGNHNKEGYNNQSYTSDNMYYENNMRYSSDIAGVTHGNHHSRDAQQNSSQFVLSENFNMIPPPPPQVPPPSSMPFPPQCSTFSNYSNMPFQSSFATSSSFPSQLLTQPPDSSNFYQEPVFYPTTNQSLQRNSFQHHPETVESFNIPLQSMPYVHLEEKSDILSLPTVSQAEICNFPSDENIHNRMWISDWLKNLGKFSKKGLKTDSKNAASSDQTEIKIHEVKAKVIQIVKLFSELENLSKSLSVTFKSLNENEWALRCSEIEEKKNVLSKLLGSLANRKQLILLAKRKLDRRRKKRERQKRKREEWKQKKVEDSVRKQQLHQSTDRWLENMQDEVERARRDEELKREADSVLSDVTRKKAEAKRQMALLSALLKLRQARVTSKVAVGQNVSQQQTEAFNNVIERLKSLWEDQLKGYALEEQGLRVMLSEAVAEEKSSEAIRKKEALHDWEVAIFGCRKISEYVPRGLAELINVRKEWDQFVVDEGTVMSSSIPPGWVIPVKACNHEWMNYNKQTK